jgi:uncharacterized protein (UPF0333 family)
MATEYEKIKLIEKATDPVTLSDGSSNTQQFYAFDPKDKGKVKDGKPVQTRSIVRDGNVVTITCLESGRAIEVPWSGVLWARSMKPQPVQAQTAKRSG